MPGLSFHCRHEYASGFVLDAQFSCGDEVTALFGPSGAGKSTVLNLIAGLIRPQTGRIQLGNSVFVDTQKNIFLAPETRGIGLVFQDDLLFPHLTVRENLRYGATRRPLSTVDFDHLTEVLDLGDLLKRYPASLSGGQRQRVALGRAILRGPALLLLDEPFNAQHLELKTRILGYLERSLREFRIPALLVAHDLATVQSLAEKVISMDAGRIIVPPNHESGSLVTALQRKTQP